jgi:hypothetical protein
MTNTTLKKILHNNALTLTELMVASILMGIVMVGVAGFGVAIKRMQDTVDKQAIVNYHAATAMAFFERHISQAYGSAADPANPVYLFNTVVAPRNYWSFRADPSRTPTNTADDNWMIFWSDQANPDTLYYCTKPYDPANGDATNFGVGQGCSPANRQIVLNENMIGNPTITFAPNNAPSILSQVVVAGITVRYSAAAASEPVDNPEVSMSSSIALLQYSNNPVP